MSTIEQTSTARLYRFRQFATVNLGDGETTYLTAALARQLADELGNLATDIERRGFSESQYGTRNLDGRIVVREGEEIEDSVAISERLLESLVNGNRRDVRDEILAMPTGRAAIVAGLMVKFSVSEQDSVLRLLDSLED